MRAVVQRVDSARATVGEETAGAIGAGLMVLVGFSPRDDEGTFSYMLDKLLGLRVFEDGEGKMNLSVRDVGGGLLLVPNFTLYGDCRKGRRPGYSSGAPSAQAEGFFSRFVAMARERHHTVESGIFQAEMKIALVNDGPVTLLLDSDRNF